MANHLRRQIREAVATLLTGLTTTGSRVYQSSVSNLKENQLPGLIIMTPEEDVEQADIGGLQQRTLNIEVIGKAKAVADVDDTLDGIAKEVEIAINASTTANTLNGLVSGIQLYSTKISISDETDRKVGEIRMSFTALYFNQAATPDVSA